jgi:hypothetical protein
VGSVLTNNYTVLTRDNISYLSRMTGLSEVELSEKMRQCEIFGFTQVYWTLGESYWYGTRFDAECVDRFGLERLVYEAKKRTEWW